jgi:hypothetical protein
VREHRRVEVELERGERRAARQEPRDPILRGCDDRPEDTRVATARVATRSMVSAAVSSGT